MSAGLIGLVTAIYASVSANELWRGNGAWALVYFGYAVANVGTIILLRR